MARMHFCLRCDAYLAPQALTAEGDPKDPDYFCRSYRKCTARLQANTAAATTAQAGAL